MPVELIGMIGTQGESRSADSTVHVSTASGVSPEYIAEFAQVHEASGFDRVLIGYRATTADGFAVASYAAHHTTKLGFLIAHRPGFVQPTVTARLAATLDQLTGGRIALHLISGATVTSRTTTPATAAPVNTWMCCGASGPARNRSTTKASSTASLAHTARSSRSNSRTYRSISGARPARP